MITYDLSLHGNLPKYEYLYRCIRGDIRGGTLKENERLPSKRALANHLVVSVSTVESAYSLLVSEGYIYPKRGCGYFVSPGKSSDFHIPPYEEADGGEKKYRIDFKANKCSLSLFPMNTWTRLMRQVPVRAGCGSSGNGSFQRSVCPAQGYLRVSLRIQGNESISGSDHNRSRHGVSLRKTAAAVRHTVRYRHRRTGVQEIFGYLRQFRNSVGLYTDG